MHVPQEATGDPLYFGPYRILKVTASDAKINLADKALYDPPI